MTSDSRSHRVLRGIGIAAAVIALAVVLTVALVDWNDMRGPIARVISARTGRPVAITGHLNVRLFSLRPRLTIEGLELGNLPWGDSGSKAFVDRLDAEMKLLPPRNFMLAVTSGGTRVDARGTLANPFAIGSYRATVRMAGRDLGDLYYLTGLALPNTPPYTLAAQVSGGRRDLALHNIVGRIGESDIRGNVKVDMSGPRRRIEADLASDSLDLADLAPAFGADEPQEQRGPRLFPDSRLQVARLRAMDGGLRLRAEAIKVRKLPLREVAFDLRLDQGVLTAERFAFTLPQGSLAGEARLDATGEMPKTQLDARITGVDLGQFKPRNAKKAPLEGVLRGRLRLAGEGDSVHEFVSNADGNVTVVVPRGEIREAFAELTGINVARGLGLMLKKDQERTRVRCGVADFEMRNGTLSAQNLVFDTDDVLIDGEGKIDLAQEAFDLSIQGHPKKLRLLRVKSPITIRGALRKPDVGLDASETLEQGGIAGALSAIAAPLAAVLAFVDPGLAEDANCGALLAEAKKEGAPVKTAEIVSAKKR